MKNNELQKRMRAVLRVLRQGARGSAEKSMTQWLHDNYYILEREARLAIRECSQARLSKRSPDLLPGLFNTCLNLCANGILPSTQELADYFTKNGLSGAHSQHLCTCLRCALLDCAAKALEGDGDNPRLMGNAVKSLRALKETDFELITEQSSEVEKILLTDPDGVYAQMDRQTRADYRRAVTQRAQKIGASESSIARRAVEKAARGKTPRSRHVGSYIFEGRGRRLRGRAYLMCTALVPLALCLIGAVFTPFGALTFLLLLPLWEVTAPLVHLVFSRSCAPKRLFRMKTDSSLALASNALITVSTLLPSPRDADRLRNRLAQLWQSNAAKNIKICCLADFKSAAMPVKPEDSAEIAAAVRIIDELNGQFGGGFLLAIRPRVYSKTQNEFTGRERKMGAISELVNAVKGDETGFCVLHGDKSTLNCTKYIIALDSDTQLVFDTAAELVAVAAHPLNRPVADKKRGAVVSGYGILVPCAKNAIADGKSTSFMRLMAGAGGITAYDSLCGETYQDMFGEGIFSGKGLLDVDSYYELVRGKLPGERVLSHDIIEGGYLRAGFVSDLQIVESFPKRSDSYYSRLHRWVRGDWQNARFIFGKRPLSALSRWQLFDNLRRSLTPAVSLAVLLGSVFFGARTSLLSAIICLLSAAAPNLLSMLHCVTHGGFGVFSRLYYSKTLPSALSCLVRAFISVMLMARTAFVCADAIAKALWRSIVSKRNLLEWTTAAQSDRKNALAASLAGCLPSAVCAVFLFVAGAPVHRLAAIIILLELPFSLLSGRETAEKSVNILEKDRELLVGYAASMWQYFADNCNAANSFLPPDNIQQSPVRAVARRTSPTNIGLMLLACLAARDMGFITSNELYMRLNLSLQSIEKLEKYCGNLLNWYSTETLEAIGDRFVSTVDSGNFLCCLVTLRQGLREYIPDCPALEGINERITALIDGTQLSRLYNPRRRLFYIGVNAKSGEPANGYYDLYMSEARMTAYYAVARREVPKKHWGAMGRILVGDGRYTGLVSWTGTMFEYFMPNLFIPAPEGSITYESLLFCLRCQQKRTGRKPWGISESGFYAFDSSLNYQYKANGVQKLGLKKGLNSELVIAPYASFLTLPMAPQASLRNLKRLEKSGFTGKYGFYEAIDYTRARCSTGYGVVSSFMAHHVGMSILGIVNALENNIMQRRFMGDREMAGAQSLLMEGIPAGTGVFKDIGYRDVPKTRERTQGKNLTAVSPEPSEPNVRVYSNGRWTSVISDCGTGVSMLDGIDITCRSSDILRRPEGVFAYFTAGGASVPFTRAPDYTSKAKFKAEFSENSAVHRAKQGNLRLKMTTSVLKRENAEKRVFSIENAASKGSIKGNLVVYFEPCLAYEKSFAAHPAFSRLFVTEEVDEENEMLVFSRRIRENEPEISIAAGFLQSTQVKFEVSREKMLTCGQGIASLTSNSGDFGAVRRGNPDACAAFSVPVTLRAHERCEFTLIITAAETSRQAVNTLLSLRTRKDSEKKAADPFYANMLDNAASLSLLPAVYYPGVCALRRAAEPLFRRTDALSDLWSFGISGENPIILVGIERLEDISAVRPYIRINRLLRTCGTATDLVVYFENDSGYSNPLSAAVKAALREENCEAMLGVSGGVHIADMSAHTLPQREALLNSACFDASLLESNENTEKKGLTPREIKRIPTPFTQAGAADNVKCFNFTNGKIEIYKTGKTPYIPWCLVLANQSFGTLVSDKSIGFTWALNSHENKLTPWFNDSRSDNRGELLLMRENDDIFDLIIGARACFTPDSAMWNGAHAGMEYTVKVQAAQRGMTKRVSLEFINTSDTQRVFTAAYYLEPILGDTASPSRPVSVRRTASGAEFFCPFSVISGVAALTCDRQDCFVATDRASFLAGNWDESTSMTGREVCVAVGKRVRLAAGGRIKLEFCLSWAKTENALRKMPSVSSFEGYQLSPVTVDTGDSEQDVFFNSFLYNQVLNSRFRARTGFWQCGGAWGFRDQLQDSLAFILAQPSLTRTHLLRSAAVQFPQGDVLHWWHIIPNETPAVKGVRTRCSDDYLWLPFVCAEYVKKTGDSGILSVRVPYICGEELHKGERERYFSPERSQLKESLLSHCLRAVELALSRLGTNGLPLMGSCDWNDGMSRVGDGGSGTSIWLAQFLIIVLRAAAGLCITAGMTAHVQKYRAAAQRLELAVLNHGVENGKFIRAFYDDGTAMGANSTAAATDILPQAFAVFADVGEEELQKSALEAAFHELFDTRSGAVRLLSPPFDADMTEKAGYIASYPPGIRENGGQYTHAAVWLALAMLKSAVKPQAYDLLTALNPFNRYFDKKTAAAYRAEPYVLAGDICMAPGIEGRAGWTHYTGSAAWYWLTVAQEIVGIKQRDGKIAFEPNLPTWCKGVTVDIEAKGTEIRFKMSKTEKSVIKPGKSATDFVPLDGGTHLIEAGF